MPVPSRPNHIHRRNSGEVSLDGLRVRTPSYLGDDEGRHRLIIGAPPAAQPRQGQDEAAKAPYGHACEHKEVAYHGPQAYEEQVLGHDLKGHARHHDGRRAREHVERLDAHFVVARRPSVRAQQHVNTVDANERDVQERPQVLRVHQPAVLEHGCNFVEHPARCVDDEGHLPPGDGALLAGYHGGGVESEEHDEVEELQHGSGPRHDQPVMVEYWRLSWVV
jgi:hypothetical protein